MISLKNTLEAIKTKLNAHEKALSVDYIVEQGTSGIWTYRKWNSGIAECWGTYTGYSKAGSGYRSFGQISFPTNLFSSIPTFATSRGSGNGYGTCQFECTDTDGGSLYSWEIYDKTTGSNVVYGIHAIGRWK